MNITDIIRNKRNGDELSHAEIETMVMGAATGSVPDYQLSAWLMAIYLQGMTENETTHLTDAMARSGDMLDLSSIPGIKVDKHSTGGVGDKVTLVLAPLVASAGLVVAKLSGRGLGHTGGTIDKLEAIPGFKTTISNQHFLQQLRHIGVAVAGQTQNLAPADKRLYALRDVTSTVESIPLIVASVLSKKIASGADVVVLDVKHGSGAFMPDYASAKTLAEMLAKVGKNLGRSVAVMLSDMEQPLGAHIGHTLEVEEAIQSLKGEGPEDLREVVLTLGAMQLMGGKKVATLEEGKALLAEKIASGEALAKFRAMIDAQGGDARVVDQPELMPHAARQVTYYAPQTGYIHALTALEVGNALKTLGGGRDSKEDILNLSVGVTLHRKRGDYVEAGDALATLHINRADTETEAMAALARAYHIENTPVNNTEALIGDLIWAG